MNMATATPPCPKCSGVLRGRTVANEFICRCGFTVDDEAIIAFGSDPARLIVAGRMTPIPDGQPGIYVTDQLGTLIDKCWDPRPCSPLPPEVDRAIREAAIEHGAKRGLLFQHDQARGAFLVVEGPSGERRELRRSTMYGLAPRGREIEAARMMVDAIAVKAGPGRWWSLLDPVHVIADDGRICIADVGGVPHVRMRAVYCHDPLPDVTCTWVEKLPTEARADRGIPVHLKSQRANADGTFATAWSHAPVDPLDVEWDELTLRELLAYDEIARREHGPRRPFTPLQRNAVSAHWSAELRKRTDAAKRKDRNQVTMEHDDE